MESLHAAEHKPKVVHRIDLIRPGGGDDAVQSRRSLCSMCLVMEEPVTPAHREGSDFSLYAIIVDRHPRVSEVNFQPLKAVGRVAYRLAERALGRYRSADTIEPAPESLKNRCGFCPPCLKTIFGHGSMIMRALMTGATGTDHITARTMLPARNYWRFQTSIAGRLAPLDQTENIDELQAVALAHLADGADLKLSQLARRLQGKSIDRQWWEGQARGEAA